MCDCQSSPSKQPESLHERFCQATHGIPCKIAHKAGALLALILGRPSQPAQCCGGHGEAPQKQCGCGGSHQ